MIPNLHCLITVDVLSQGKNELKSSNLLFNWVNRKGISTVHLLSCNTSVTLSDQNIFCFRQINIINYLSHGPIRRFEILLYRETCSTSNTLRYFITPCFDIQLLDIIFYEFQMFSSHLKGHLQIILDQWLSLLHQECCILDYLCSYLKNGLLRKKIWYERSVDIFSRFSVFIEHVTDDYRPPNSDYPMCL